MSGKNKKQNPTENRILDTAESFFARKGYDGTTTRQIAVEAGISIQTLHYHCSNKMNLFNQVLLRSIIPVTKMLNRHIEDMLAKNLNDDRVLQESIARLIDELFTVLHRNPNFPLLFFRQWLEQNPDLRQVEWDQLVPFIRKWTEEVELKVGEERLQGIDLALTFISLSFIYWGLFSNPTFMGKFLNLEFESPDFINRMKTHALEITLRLLGRKDHRKSSEGKD